MADHLQSEDLLPDHALGRGDPDRFNHSAIAGRVAELVCSSATPVNVALFGSWGSGKSSFFELLKRELPSDVAAVHYDAWKFGGASLKRNFISHAATELGLPEGPANNEPFHRGLYESRRSIDLSFSSFIQSQAWRIVRGGLVAIGVVIAVGFLLALALEAALEQPAVGTWTSLILAFAGPAAVVIASIVAAVKLAEVAKVEVERSAPAADEQFTKTFRALLSQARTRGQNARGAKRFVFFVDELDRCSRSDVVETLSAVRAFLDLPDCIFIVVADRDVLEQALESLPQATPTNEHTPYYSSASEFLDKIFQYQIALPPLRTGRLTGFATDLVTGRGGLWGELSAAGELERVLYVLIPSHVRSPRRVKVLLNRFATNARIGEARGVQWLERAAEVAKLTVLQTEFPTLAEALVIEPRLLGALTTGEVPPTFSARSRRLLEVYRILPSEPVNVEEVDHQQSLDPLLVEDAGGAIARTQREQLLRYLRRTASVPSPARDLLYLEAAGVSLGLDPSIGQRLEDLAPEVPNEALAQIEDQQEDQRVAAIRFLCQLTDKEVGVERSNVLTALLGAVERFDRLDLRVATEVASTVRSYIQAQDLEDSHLLGAVRVALWSKDLSLLSIVFRDSRLLANADRLAEVAAHLEELPEEQRKGVIDRLAEEAAAQPAVLKHALGSVSSETAERLLDEVGASPWTMVENMAQGDAGEAQTLASSLFLASDDPLVRLEVLWMLLNHSGDLGYGLAKQQQSLITDHYPPKVQVSYALSAIAVGPVTDWEEWLPLLTGGPHAFQAGRSRAVVDRILSERSGLSEDAERVALSIVDFAAAQIASGSEETQQAVLNAVAQGLQTNVWWQTSKSRAQQMFLHRLASALASGDGAFAEQVASTRHQDLVRGLARPQIVTEETLIGLRDMSGDLTNNPLLDLERRLFTLQQAGVSAAIGVTATKTRLDLLGRVVERGGAPPPEVRPAKAEVLALAGEKQDSALTAVGTWLLLEPPKDEIVEVARAITRSHPRRGPKAFADWFRQKDESQRTELLFEFWSSGVTGAEWIHILREIGVDEQSLTDSLVSEVLAASRWEDRAELIDRILALAPKDPRAQKRVGDLVVELFATDKKVDFGLALRAFPSLGTRHQSKTRIEAALRQATEATGEKLTRSQVKSVEAAGIRPPKRSFTERAWAKWKDITS